MDDRPLAVRPPTRKRKVKKSEAIWRKSELSTCARVSQSVVEMSRSVVRMSPSVVNVSPLAPILESRAFDLTRDNGSNCGKQIGELRSKRRLLGSQKPKKHPKKRFWSDRNCDLRRLACSTQREWHRFPGVIERGIDGFFAFASIAEDV